MIKQIKRKIKQIKTNYLPGNNKQYSLANTTKNNPNTLTNKKILFLGSSVTLGHCSKLISFVDYLGYQNDIQITKEAISGTTLKDNLPNSYISRYKKINTNTKLDMLFCQLSTNDAYRDYNLGSISDSFDINDFDTNTTIGAIEYIIAYTKKYFNCKIVFYTSPYFESESYEAMVNSLIKLQAKWHFDIIDMYNDKTFNNISKEAYKLYMADPIHPTMAGYKLWWTPYIEKELINIFNK